MCGLNAGGNAFELVIVLCSDFSAARICSYLLLQTHCVVPARSVESLRVVSNRVCVVLFSRRPF